MPSAPPLNQPQITTIRHAGEADVRDVKDVANRFQKHVADVLNPVLKVGTTMIHGAPIPAPTPANAGQQPQYNGDTKQFDYVTPATGGVAVPNGVYGDATNVPQITVLNNTITGITNVPISFPSGYTEVYRLDLTAQASQDFKAGGDGNYTIDGKTWTLGNTAGCTQAQIVLGTGLILEAAASSPVAYVTLIVLQSLIEMFRRDVIVYVHSVSSGLSNVGCYEVIELGNTGDTWRVSSGHYRSGGGPVWLSTGGTNSTGSLGTGGPTTTNNLTDEVIVLRPFAPLTTGTFSGAAPTLGAMPAWNTLTKRGVVQIAQNVNADDPGASDMVLILQAGNTPTKMIVKLITIEMR